MRVFLALSVLAAGAAGTAFARVDTALLNLVPADAMTVSGIDVEHARGSQFGQYFLAKLGHEDDDFRRFVMRTGFDPRRDLRDVLIATGSVSGGGDAPQTLILAHGVFNPAKIESAAKAYGRTIQNYRGVELIVDNKNPSESAVAFLDADTVVMSNVATLKTIVANRGTSTTLDPALSQLIESVGADNDAWFASTHSGAYLARHMEHELHQQVSGSQAVQSIRQASGGIRFGDTVTLTLDAKTRSPQDAVSLVDVARFFTSMVQMQRQHDPRAAIVATALDKMVLTTDGDSMHVSVSLSEKDIEQLAQLGSEDRPAAVSGSTPPPKTLSR